MLNTTHTTQKDFVNEFYTLHSAAQVASDLNDLFYLALTSPELPNLVEEKQLANWFGTIRNLVQLVEQFQPPELNLKEPFLNM